MKKYMFCFAAAAAVLAVGAAEKEVKPVHSTGVSFSAGKVGKGAVLTEKSRIYFDGKAFTPSGGTVETWVCPAEAAPAGKQNFLISSGNNNPFWFFWGFDGKGVNFLSRSRKDARTFEHYSSVRMAYNVPAGEWTHLALVWCRTAPGESLVQLYVNGKAVIEKFDQSLGGNDGGSLGIGCNTAGRAAPAFCGVIDELMISDTPLAPGEILKRYELGKSGKTVAPDRRTVLYLGFEDTVSGKSFAPVPDLKKLAADGEKLLDQIVGE